MNPPLPTARDRLLFTPGPLTTSLSVKQAMLHDAGSWHSDFNDLVRGIREELLRLTGVSRAGEFEVVLMQGSGTFGIEATIGSVIPPDGKLLAVTNGAYGDRIARMAAVLRIPTTILRSPETETPSPAAIEAALRIDPAITDVTVVHCETTTGILNPIGEIGTLVKRLGRRLIVDAMSSFGAIPIDLEAAGIDYLVSSPNKCIEGVPGFSFVIARRAELLATEGFARSLSLDLLGQSRGFEATGQFRYTPPTHAILAFQQALRELADEGGFEARGRRYRENHNVLMQGMEGMGFRSVLPPAVQSFIITSFYYPKHPAFQFDQFYRRLAEKGMIIYPGKLTEVDCFRIGTIGRIFAADIRYLLAAIEASFEEMGIAMDQETS